MNLSSVAGLFRPIDLAAYGAAKAGIVGFSRAAALNLADFGITVNAIAPGPIETELMLGVWTAEALRERPQHGAIARFGNVDEIAHAALFLASPDSGFITGTTLAVDGGAIAAVDLLEATKALESITDHVRLTVTREGLTVLGEGDVDKASLVFRPADGCEVEMNGDERHTSLFPLDYLQAFLKSVKSEKLVLRLGTDYPVRADWDGTTRGTYLLAPRIENTE